MIKELTCIICPQGCNIKVEIEENGNIKNVEGNTCKRGYEYAVNEVSNPVRTITTTVKMKNGKMLSVNDSIDFSVSMTIFHLIIMRTV